MKKILITGGGGYIGSMLATELIRVGHKVTVVDLLKYDKGSLDHLYFEKNFTFVNGDVRNLSLLKTHISKNEFIIPMAALVGAPLCEKNKKEAIQTNFRSIKKILQNFNKKNKLIFLTTNSGYGVGEKNKFCSEKSPLKPISLYGKTKCDAEIEVMKFKNTISFRLATVFGASYRMRSDLLVNNFVERAVNKNFLDIFEPKFRRNFIHIKDVVRGIIFAIDNFNRLKSNVYNLGLSSANITKIDLALKIKKQFKTVKIKIIKNKKDPDKRDYFVSNSKIERKGFKAKISLETGIKELISVFSNNKKRIINNY
ncbi:NAD(P)-dependent oxidoreductase [Pelagibacteraceae bacterium]|jgi:nucleoside-diphosphate-sugar epimerase|nr:NAD(P)-dependent oxidoreductase [Pelagibacteraceae bacterium]